MSNYTPGPWQFYQTENDKIRGHWSISRIPGEPPMALVEQGYSFFVGYARERDAAANARLIAAAPDLLGALNGVLKLIEDGLLVRDTREDYDITKFMEQAARLIAHLAACQSAIDKAEGQ